MNNNKDLEFENDYLKGKYELALKKLVQQAQYNDTLLTVLTTLKSNIYDLYNNDKKTVISSLDEHDDNYTKSYNEGECAAYKKVEQLIDSIFKRII